MDVTVYVHVTEPSKSTWYSLYVLVHQCLFLTRNIQGEADILQYAKCVSVIMQLVLCDFVKVSTEIL